MLFLSILFYKKITVFFGFFLLSKKSTVFAHGRPAWLRVRRGLFALFGGLLAVGSGCTRGGYGRRLPNPKYLSKYPKLQKAKSYQKKLLTFITVCATLSSRRGGGVTMNVTEIIREIMKSRGFNQSILAERCGVKRQSNISEYLKHNNNMRLNTVLAMLDAMDYDIVIRSRLTDKTEYKVEVEKK